MTLIRRELPIHNRSILDPGHRTLREGHFSMLSSRSEAFEKAMNFIAAIGRYIRSDTCDYHLSASATIMSVRGGGFTTILHVETQKQELLTLLARAFHTQGNAIGTKTIVRQVNPHSGKVSVTYCSDYQRLVD